MNLDDALQRYEVDYRANGYSPATIVHTKQCVGILAVFLNGVPDVGKVTADDFRCFLYRLRSSASENSKGKGQPRDNLSGTSINTYARAVRAFWSWLQREGIIPANPLAVVKAVRYRMSTGTGLTRSTRVSLPVASTDWK